MGWVETTGGAVQYIEENDYMPAREVPADFVTGTISGTDLGGVPLHDYEFAAGDCVELYDDLTKYPKGTMDEKYGSEIWIPRGKK